MKTETEIEIIKGIRAYCDACINGESGTSGDSPSILSALVNVVDSRELYSHGKQAERELEIARFLLAHRNDIPRESNKTPKTALQSALVALLPQVEIVTLWETDTDGDFDIFDEGNALENESREDWHCWQSEVRATVIVDGERVAGSAYLGGTWVRFGDKPEETNPTVSGYETDLIIEALHELNAELFKEKYQGTARARVAISYALQKIETWKTEKPLFGSPSITGSENA